MDLTSRFLRYVDNRLCLVDPSWLDGPAFVTFLHREFYGAPIILETEPDQEFLHQYRNLGPTTNTEYPHADHTDVGLALHLESVPRGHPYGDRLVP